jgi:hemolysin III
LDSEAKALGALDPPSRRALDTVALKQEEKLGFHGPAGSGRCSSERYALSMVDDLRRGAERMGERAGAAREAVGEKATAAKDAAKGAATDAIDAASEAIAAVKPKLRGVSHEWAFFISLFLGAGLIIAAKTPKATVAVAIYAVSLSALLGTSALYHRVNWSRPNVRRWMRRLDHSMIFFLIAGTYTPFALLVLNGPLADAILVVVWAGAFAGAIVEMVWIEHPKWVAALIYLSLGWVAVISFPELWDSMGTTGTLLVAAGGLLYTAGAVVYATQRPNPNPRVFGYHEVFHLLVIAAAAAHFAAVAFFALPAA